MVVLERSSYIDENFFRGKYEIQVGGKVVGSYDERGSFGELALMYNMPRAATIIALTTGSLWAMVGVQDYVLVFLTC